MSTEIQKRSGRKQGLGRGLGAIFQDSSPAKTPEVQETADVVSITDAGSKGGSSPATGLRTMPVTALQPGTFQPRRVFDEEALTDLAASIRSKGVLEPLIVRQVSGGAFEIIAGERRWRAAQMAQLHDVPVIVKTLTDADALEIALIENIQREDLTPLEEAHAYEQLITQFAYTQEQLAGALGRSRSHVTNMMRLLKLPSDVQDMVASGALTAGHARALLTSDAPKRLAEDVVRRGLNVRQTEKLVADTAKTGGRRRPSVGLSSNVQEKDADTRALETALIEALGLSVSITHRADGTGDLTISYRDVEQLDDLCSRLQGAG